MSEVVSIYKTIKEYAEYRSVCVNTVRKWIGMGLPVFRMGKIVRVKWQEGDAWLDSVTAPVRRASRSA